jgi:azurin
MRAPLLLLGLALTLTACGGGGGGTAEVALTPVGDEMRYAQTEFTVAPGQTVHLVLNNTATSPAMRHNVVVLQQGSDVAAFGTAAVAAAATDYIPPALESQVIAHTAMSNPGETVEVTFTAPDQPGDYPFLCSFPGHFATMQGTMRVQG